MICPTFEAKHVAATRDVGPLQQIVTLLFADPALHGMLPTADVHAGGERHILDIILESRIAADEPRGIEAALPFQQRDILL